LKNPTDGIPVLAIFYNKKNTLEEELEISDSFFKKDAPICKTFKISPLCRQSVGRERKNWLKKES
jgi:hypothetical protein